MIVKPLFLFAVLLNKSQNNINITKNENKRTE